MNSPMSCSTGVKLGAGVQQAGAGAALEIGIGAARREAGRGVAGVSLTQLEAQGRLWVRFAGERWAGP